MFPQALSRLVSVIVVILLAGVGNVLVILSVILNRWTLVILLFPQLFFSDINFPSFFYCLYISYPTLFDLLLPFEIFV